MPLSEPQLVELTRRFQTILARLSVRSSAAVTRLWDRLDGYDEADIARFVKQTSNLFTATKSSTVAASAGFYSTIAEVRAPAIPSSLIKSAPDTRGPFTVVWRALGNGHDYTDAVGSGRARLEASVSDLVHETSRETGGVVAEQTGMKVVGWQRVLGPGSCDWCVKVCTQRYHSAESANFGHDRCKCIIAPVFRHADPGRILNAPLLDSVNGATAPRS